MNILNLLSSTQGAKNNEANIALAKDIAATNNKEAIAELVANLNHENKRVQGDCIKVLYETGYIKPKLLANYHKEFLKLLNHEDNRMIWGSMVALANITLIKHKEIFAELELLKETIKNGSVITIDCGVDILTKLTSIPAYFDTTDPLLAEQLWNCPIKQLPQYAEKSLICIKATNKEIYQNLLQKRIDECDKDSQKKRIEKVLKKINNI